jgi:ABC-type glycerol-3-phosphate transport system substrate-binding protein
LISSKGDDMTSTLWSFMLAQLGGAITNADGTEITLDNEQGIAAALIAKKIWDAQIAIDEGMYQESLFAAIKGNKVAALPAPVWYRGYGLEPNITSPNEGGQGQWRVALLPRPAPGATRTANLGGASVVSTKYTKYPAEVKLFMEFALATMEGATQAGDWGIQRLTCRI